MVNNCVVDILKNVRVEYEKNPNFSHQEVLLVGIKNVIIECRIPGVTIRNLDDSKCRTTKYKEAIAVLKDNRVLTEIKFGKTNVLFLTDLIEYAAEKLLDVQE